MAVRGAYRGRGPRIGGGARAAAFAALLLATFFVFTHRSEEAREATEPARASIDDFVVGVLKRFNFGGRVDTVAALEAEVRELSRWRIEAAAQAERLRTLEALVSMREEPMPLGIVARTIIESAGPFERSRLANAGFDQGVREDFAAVNEHGLVGRVLQVGSRSSRILLVSDFNSRIPVMSEKQGNRALMRGDGGTTMILENIDSIGDLTAGERWLTSGEDGRLLRGIPVGVAFQDSGQRWRLIPLAAQGSEDFVRLLPPPDIDLPEPIGPFALPETLAAQLQTQTGATAPGASAPAVPAAVRPVPAVPGGVTNPAPPARVEPAPSPPSAVPAATDPFAAAPAGATVRPSAPASEGVQPDRPATSTTVVATDVPLIQPAPPLEGVPPQTGAPQ